MPKKKKRKPEKMKSQEKKSFLKPKEIQRKGTTVETVSLFILYETVRRPKVFGTITEKVAHTKPRPCRAEEISAPQKEIFRHLGNVFTSASMTPQQMLRRAHTS